MRNTRIVRLGALGVMLGALAASGVGAQETTPAPQVARPSLETFFTRTRFDAGPARLNADGVGARIMWRGGSLVDEPNALWRHLDLGVFGAYSPKRAYDAKIDAATYHFGAAADVRAFASPLGGRLDPFASLGLGVLATHVSTTTYNASSLFRDSASSFTLDPGVGARLMLASFVGVQGALRDVMTFNGGTRHNPAWEAGLRMSF